MTSVSRPLPTVSIVPTIHASVSDLAKVFTEWDRRYRENSERFMTEVEHLLKETPYTYGNAGALYFAKLFKEIIPE